MLGHAARIARSELGATCVDDGIVDIRMYADDQAVIVLDNVNVLVLDNKSFLLAKPPPHI